VPGGAARMPQSFNSKGAPERPLWPRKAARVGLSAEIVLRRQGQASYRVRIMDVSLHGCRAEFVERPKLDEQVWVKFDGLQSLEAMVCWVRGFDVGLEFEAPIHPAVFDMLLAKLKG
jgi:hypothetical protein